MEFRMFWITTIAKLKQSALDGNYWTLCESQSDNPLISARLAATKLDVVIVLLLLFPFGSFVIGLAASARAEKNSKDEEKNEILFHEL